MRNQTNNIYNIYIYAIIYIYSSLICYYYLWDCYNRKILRWCAVKQPTNLLLLFLFTLFICYVFVPPYFFPLVVPPGSAQPIQVVFYPDTSSTVTTPVVTTSTVTVATTTEQDVHTVLDPPPILTMAHLRPIK